MTNVVTSSETKIMVAAVNSKVNEFVCNLRSTQRHPLTVGPVFKNIGPQGAQLHLAAARMVGKWYTPDKSKRDILIQKCYEDWICHEEYLWNFNFKAGIYNTDPEIKRLHFQARHKVHSMLRGFKINFHDLEFTPGSTFFKTKEGTGILRKLKDLSHWTVTLDALDDALELIVNVPALLNSSLAHLSKVYHKDFLRSADLTLLKELIQDHLLTIVDGARGSSVEKNSTTRRFINIEPMFNMLLQRLVAHGIRRLLAKHNNDLETGQDVHKLMIKRLEFATVDWKNASDSNLLEWVRWLFPPSVYAFIERYRSYYTIINRSPSGDDPEFDEYYVNCKMSAMGNGFTFEVMTLCLLAYARVLCDQSRVYGDDVIISASHAPLYIRALESVSWILNDQKTFLDGKFRESCGAFYYEGYGYLETYDFRWATSPEEAIILLNKMRRISGWLPGLEKVWQNCMQVVPALLKGPLCHSGVNSEWVEVSNHYRTKKKDPRCRSLWKKFAPIRECAQQLWQKEVVAINIGYFFKSHSVKLSADVTCVFEFYTYLYSGRRTDDIIRGKGKWRQREILIFSDGSYCLASYVRLVRQKIKVAALARSQAYSRMLETLPSRYINTPPIILHSGHP